MIPHSFDYAAATSFADALEQVAAGAKPLSGGMSLIPMMKLRLAAPERVVDLGRIQGLNYIHQDQAGIHVGALATHFEIESSALLRAGCPLLAETAGWIGDVQIRNRGTIGGSVAHADPSADYPAALVALDAHVVVASKRGGERTLPARDFFVDAFTTAAEPDELVKEIIVPVETLGTSYQKLLQPASGFAIVGVAARIGQDGKGCLGVTGLGAKPILIADATDLSALNTTEANSDIHASSAYRREMAKVYARRAIAAARARA